METIQVYRVEDVYGYGPYWNWSYDSPLGGMYIKHSVLPTPQAEGIRKMDEEEFCGFKSIEALKYWFYGYRSLLGREGFLVATYEVDARHVRHGAKQLVFKKNKAKLVKKRKFSSI